MSEVVIDIIDDTCFAILTSLLIKHHLGFHEEQRFTHH